MRCPKKQCGAVLAERFDTIGRVVWECRACARFAAGICRDCPLPREKPDDMTHRASPRCTSCRVRHRKDLDRANQIRNRERKAARKRERYHADPEFRRRCTESTVRYQKKIGRDDLTRAYERAMSAKYRAQRRAKLVPRGLLPRLSGKSGRAFDQAPAELKPAIMAIAKLEHALAEKAS